MEVRTMSKKHIIYLIFLVFCFLTIGSQQAWAEGFMDIYGGGSVTGNADAEVSRNVSSLGAVSREIDTEKVDFGSSFTAGYRFGCWSEKYPYLGIAGDLSYFRAGNEAVKVYAVPISFLLMLRWPLLKSRDFPKGRIQPYVGIGPGFFYSYSEADFQPDLSDTVSGISLDIGLDARAGIAWQFQKHLALFGEYRYTNFTVDLETTSPLYGFAGSKDAIKTRVTTNHFLIGISYRF
jgi:opacity protein-like surface antigen